MEWRHLTCRSSCRPAPSRVLLAQAARRPGPQLIADVRPTEMHRPLAAIAFILFAIGAYSTVQACSCATVGADNDYRGLLLNTDAVFRGTVIRVHDLTPSPAQDIQFVPLRLVIFQVNGAWKGITHGTAFVFTGRGGGDCGFPFQQGTEYVVWATRDSYMAPGELSTDICRSTREVQYASEQLKQLGTPKQVTK